MMGLRNPFYINYAEQLESEAQFLQLYSPGMLNVLPTAEALWGRIAVIRSAPGGGKTSLLRLFTPTALLTLHAYRNVEAYKDLFAKLRTLDAVDDTGTQIIGAVLSLAHTFRLIADVAPTDAQGLRSLFALLNSRIALAVIRAAVIAARGKYPDDLGRLKLSPTRSIDGMDALPQLTNGREVFEWACGLERETCDLVDNPGSPVALPSHSSLFTLFMLNADSLSFDGKPIGRRTLVMFDDVQYLHPIQRQALLQELGALRAPTNTWVAERMEALSGLELLSPGQERRDWQYVYLESHWRSASPHAFVAFAGNVADRRADAGTSSQITSFRGHLASEVAEGAYETRLANFIAETQKRLKDLCQDTEGLQSWLESHEFRSSRTLLGKAREIQSTAIVLERQKRKRQMAFGFVAPDEEMSTDVSSAAELFVSKAAGIPYYYGFERLCLLASYNIEQFLSVSGDEFEHILSGLLLGEPGILDAEKQHRLAKERAHVFLRDCLRRLPEPATAGNLIRSIGLFCRDQTYQPNAPYSPGVTGIGLLASDREKLARADSIKDPQMKHLGKLLSLCVAENLLMAHELRCKGQAWVVFYMNRLLGAEYDLPLQYGGWRPRTLRQAQQWLTHPYGSGRSEDLI